MKSNILALAALGGALLALATTGASAAADAYTYLKCSPDNPLDHYSVVSYTWRLKEGEMAFWDVDAGYWSHNWCREAPSPYSPGKCAVTADYYRWSKDSEPNILTFSRRTGKVTYSTQKRTDSGTCVITTAPVSAPPKF